MSAVVNDIDVGGVLTFTSSNRASSYVLSSPISTGTVSLSLPPTQGSDGQLLVKSGSGSSTAWVTPVGAIPAACKALFSTAFIQNNGNDSVQFSGSSSLSDIVVCRFFYQGSTIVPLSMLSVVASSGSSSPTGTIKIKNGALEVCSISYSGITSTPTIYSTTSFSNVPTSPSVLTLVVNMIGSTNKLNIHSFMLQ